MLELLKNKSQTFECTIDLSEDIDVNNSYSRIILKQKNGKSLYFDGELNDNVVKINIPALNTASDGTLILEIIENGISNVIYEDIYKLKNTKIDVLKVNIIPENNIKLKNKFNKIQENNDIKYIYEYDYSKNINVNDNIIYKKNKKINENKKKDFDNMNNLTEDQILDEILKFVDDTDIENIKFTKSITESNKKEIKYYIDAFNKMTKKDKKVIIQYITEMFSPKDSTLEWARKNIIKNNRDTKIIMYLKEINNKILN